MGYFCSIFGCWALTSVESGPTLLRDLEHRFSCNKPPLRCVGWDRASFPVLRRRWVFPCIFYTISCSSGFLGEFGSCTEVSPVSLNRDFSTLFHFRDGKKADSLYMVLWEVLLSSMAGQVLYFQKRFCWRTRFAIKIGMSYFLFGDLTLLSLAMETKPRWLGGVAAF